MTWWLWGVLGCALLILELLAPGGFFFLFFGVGAIITGVISMFGVIESDTLQIALFTLISVVLVVVLRKKVKLLFLKSDASAGDLDGLVGQTGVAADSIGANETGNVELRGSNWSAKNVGTAALAKGAVCKVESVSGLTLNVRAK